MLKLKQTKLIYIAEKLRLVFLIYAQILRIRI